MNKNFGISFAPPNTKGFVDASSGFADSRFWDPLGQGLESDSFKFYRDQIEKDVMRWQDKPFLMHAAPTLIAILTVACMIATGLYAPALLGFVIVIGFIIISIVFGYFTSSRSEAVLWKYAKDWNYFYRPKRDVFNGNQRLMAFYALSKEMFERYSSLDEEFWLQNKNCWFAVFAYRTGGENDTTRHDVVFATKVEGKRDFCVRPSEFGFFSSVFEKKYHLFADGRRLGAERYPEFLNVSLQQQILNWAKEVKLRQFAVKNNVLFMSLSYDLQNVGRPGKEAMEKISQIVDTGRRTLEQLKGMI